MSWGGERYVLALRILDERRRSGNVFFYDTTATIGGCELFY